jgi:hypothetical protein
MPSIEHQQRRIALLSKRQAWMTPQMMMSFAASGMSDDEVLHQAELVRQALVAEGKRNPASDWKSIFHDPVLQKSPGVASAIKDFVVGAGAQGQLTKRTRVLQARIQEGGFGKHLAPNGVMTDEWNDALQEWYKHKYNVDQGGGGFSFSNVLSEGVSLLNPAHDIDILTGIVKGIPSEGRQLFADVAFAGTTFGGYLAMPVTGDSREDVAYTSHQVGAAIENIGNHREVTPQGFARGIGVPAVTTSGPGEHGKYVKGDNGDIGRLFGRGLSDAATVTLLADGVGAAAKGVNFAGAATGIRTGSALAEGVGVDSAAAASAEATQGGLIARATNLTDATHPAYRGPGVIARWAGQPTAEVIGRGLSHVPGMSKFGGWVDALADEAGAYYKARRIAAIPYNYRAVRVAGSAVTDLTLKGAKYGAVGILAPDSAMGQAIGDSHVIQDWDEQHRWLDVPGLGKLGWGDIAALSLHAPLHGSGSASARVGRSATEDMSAIKDALSRTGYDGLMQQAYKEVLKGVDRFRIRRALVRMAGGEENYVRWVIDTVHDKSAWYGAERNVMRARAEALDMPGIEVPGPGGTLSPEAKLRNEELLGQDWDFHDAVHAEYRRIKNDPAALKQAERDMISDGGGQKFIQMVRRDITDARNKAAYRGEEYIPGTLPRLRNRLEAMKFARREVLPWTTDDETALTSLGGESAHAPFNQGHVSGKDLALINEGTWTKQGMHRRINELRDAWEEFDAAEAARAEAARGADQGSLADPDAIEAIDDRFPEPPRGWRSDIRKALYDLAADMGLDARAMAAEDLDLMDSLKAYGDKYLVSELTLSKHAPQALVNAVEKLRTEHGYILATGGDLGHTLVNGGPIDQLAGSYRWHNRIADFLGLNPEVRTSADKSAAFVDGLRNRWLRLIESGKVTLPEYVNVDTLVALAHDPEFMGESPTIAARLRQGAEATRRAPKYISDERNPFIADLARDIKARTADISERDALRLARAAAAQGVNFGLRDTSWEAFKEAFVDARSHEERLPASAGHEATTEAGRFKRGSMFTEDEARLLHRELLRASMDVGPELVGLQHLEDLFRNSLGFAGNGFAGRTVAGAIVGGAAGVAADPDAAFNGDLSNVLNGVVLGAAGGAVFKNFGWAMANLPNNLLRVRNELRFDLSPAFATKRWAKSNVRMALNGVEPVARPLRWLERRGVLDEARTLLERTAPDYTASVRRIESYGDDMRKYAEAQDLFHLYNARTTEAYAAWQWHLQGKSEDEIRDLLNQTFGYTSRDTNGALVAGRSALESSVNFVFFPFSFDKTLYKALSGAVIDTPARRYILHGALTTYHEFSKQHPDMPGASDWIDKHLPLFQEVEHLNAFSTGLHLPAPGGINRALIQAFLPQSWTPGTHTRDVLEEFVPAIRDLNDIFQGRNGQAGLFSEQWDIARAEVTGSAPAETGYAQLQDAFKRRRTLVDTFGDVIRYNSGRPRDEQVKFPTDPAFFQAFGIDPQWAGAPISKGTIDRLIGVEYPAYRPEEGVKIAIEKQERWSEYMHRLQTTQPSQAAVDEHQDFFDLTNDLGKWIEDARYLRPGDTGYRSPEQLNRVADALREVAIRYAQEDPEFYALYRRLFQRTLGPLSI